MEHIEPNTHKKEKGVKLVWDIGCDLRPMINWCRKPNDKREKKTFKFCRNITGNESVLYFSFLTFVVRKGGTHTHTLNGTKNERMHTAMIFTCTIVLFILIVSLVVRSWNCFSFFFSLLLLLPLTFTSNHFIERKHRLGRITKDRFVDKSVNLDKWIKTEREWFDQKYFFF